MLVFQMSEHDAVACGIGSVLSTEGKSPVAVGRNLNISAETCRRITGACVLRQSIVYKVDLLVGIIGTSVKIIERELSEGNRKPVPASRQLICIVQGIKRI